MNIKAKYIIELNQVEAEVLLKLIGNLNQEIEEKLQISELESKMFVEFYNSLEAYLK